MRKLLNKQIKRAAFLLLLLTIGLISCLDPIDLDIPRGFEETLVIQSVLTRGNPSVIDLNVSRLFDFTPESLERVNVRVVELSDDDGNNMEVKRVGIGTYQHVFTGAESISVEVGKSYKVRVSTFDGRVLESTLEPLLDVPEIDSIQFVDARREIAIPDQEVRFDSVIRFSLNTPLAAPNTDQNVGLLWDVKGVFELTDSPTVFGVSQKTCYITRSLDITNVKVFDGYNTDATEVRDQFLYETPFTFVFAEGFFLEVTQSSLSPGAVSYWDQINELLEREGDMFEAPAGQLTTNLVNINDPEDKILGYFYATSTSTERVYVSPEFARNPRKHCPPPADIPAPPGGCALPLCCDCLDEPISTTLRPGYWID
ncbi:MAG: DUF4249 family protein [Bacteroidota bacterium]